MSVLSDSAYLEEHPPEQQVVDGSTMDLSVSNCKCDSSVSMACECVLSDRGETANKPCISGQCNYKTCHGKKVQGPLTCDSHIMPIFRVDEEDETPMLHRTDNSVWSSYAAKNLRSMRDGSYSENGSGGSFCSSLEVNSKVGDKHVQSLQNCGSKQGTDKFVNCELAVINTESMLAQFPKSILVDSSKVNTAHSSEKKSITDVLLQHDPNAFSNTSIEVARGVVPALDESLSIMHSYNKSRLLSVACSADLEASSDFSAHFQQHDDKVLNSTRLSLDFGLTHMSLDTGPELRDLSQLSGLSRIVLKAVAPEENTSGLVPCFNVVPSKKSESLIRKQNDLAPGSGPLLRKLSKPGLRRVLSDTFDRCLPSRTNSCSSASRCILKNKSKSLDYSLDPHVDDSGCKPSRKCRKLPRKRAFQNTVDENTDNSFKNVDMEYPTYTDMTPELCKMMMQECEGGRPIKQICFDKNMYGNNSDQESLCKLGALPEKCEQQQCKQEEVIQPVCSPLGQRLNFPASPCMKVSANNPLRHPKVALLRECKTYLTCSGHTGLTEEINVLALKDILADHQATSKVAVVKDGLKLAGHSTVGCSSRPPRIISSESESYSDREDYTGSNDIQQTGPPIHRVPASENLSSLYGSPLWNTDDDPEAVSKENDLKFFISTPSPGSTRYSSPAPGNMDHPALIMKKGVSTMDSSIGTDCSLLNVTIEYEVDGKLSPRCAFVERFSGSPIQHVPSDTGGVGLRIQRLSVDSDTSLSDHPNYFSQPLPSPVSAPEEQWKSDGHELDKLQQPKQRAARSGSCESLVGERQQKMLYTNHKLLPSVAERVISHEGGDSSAIFIKPQSYVSKVVFVILCIHG